MRFLLLLYGDEEGEKAPLATTEQSASLGRRRDRHLRGVSQFRQKATRPSAACASSSAFRFLPEKGEVRR